MTLIPTMNSFLIFFACHVLRPENGCQQIVLIRSGATDVQISLSNLQSHTPKYCCFMLFPVNQTGKAHMNPYMNFEWQRTQNLMDCPVLDACQKCHLSMKVFRAGRKAESWTTEVAIRQVQGGARRVLDNFGHKSQVLQQLALCCTKIFQFAIDAEFGWLVDNKVSRDPVVVGFTKC